MANKYPTQTENPEGLHARYIVTKANGESDGQEDYFVLRLDPDGDDEVWTAVCRVAARCLAAELLKLGYMEKLAHELIARCDLYDEVYSPAAAQPQPAESKPCPVCEQRAQFAKSITSGEYREQDTKGE